MTEEWWYLLEVLGGIAAAVVMIWTARANHKRDTSTDERVSEHERRIENLETAEPPGTDADVLTRLARLEATVEAALRRLEREVERIEREIAEIR